MEGKAMRVVLKTIMPLLMIALVVGQPNIPTPNTPTAPTDALPPPATPGGGGQLPPGGGGGMLPPGGGLLTPTLPGDGMFPPLLPGDDGTSLILPFIPGIGSIDLPRRKCAGKCALQCRKSKRNRLAAKMCTTFCLVRCGIKKSNVNVVDDCTSSCANSVSPDSISDDVEAQSLVDSCFERCKNN